MDVLGSKMELDTREFVDNGLWFHPHLYDREERAFVRSHAKPGVFLDVGANIGFWSLYLAHEFTGSKIISVEANPNTARIFRKNVMLNGYDNVELIELGVGPVPGSFDLFLNTTGNRGGDSFVSDGSRSHKVSVDVRRLSDLIAERGIEEIEFMKIDVEGMEEGVFSDLFERLARRVWPRMICVETLHSPGVVTLLREHGYTVALKARENSIFLYENR